VLITEVDVWYVMPCSLVERYQSFGGTCIFSLRTADTSVLKTEDDFYPERWQKTSKNKLLGLSPRANYIDRANVICRRS
jgi:hypothetical protein